MGIERYPSSQSRRRAIGFLLESAQNLEVSPVVKYTALSLFAARFWPSLVRSGEDNGVRHWLLQPMEESNLQLFALISLWISSKMHNSRPMMLKNLKSWGDSSIADQHFTRRDFSEAELIFLQVLNFETGDANNAFVCLEELYFQFREVAKVGELLNFEACMDVMDLCYEEESLIRRCSPPSLAASVFIASYLITVPKQMWEFPLLSWMKFSAARDEEEITGLVKRILQHVFGPICKSGEPLTG